MPSCDVLSGSKVSIDVVDMSSVVEETVMWFPLATATSLMVHVAVGELIKPATVFDTVQFRLYMVPALAVPDLLTVATTASEGTEERKLLIHFYLIFRNIRACITTLNLTINIQSKILCCYHSSHPGHSAGVHFIMNTIID